MVSLWIYALIAIQLDVLGKWVIWVQGNVDIRNPRFLERDLNPNH